MKLTDLQIHQIHEALSNSQTVLRQIKQKPLKGKALEEMHILESAVSSLEIFSMTIK